MQRESGAAVALLDAGRAGLRAVRLTECDAAAAGGPPPAQRRALAAVPADPEIGVGALARVHHVDQSSASTVARRLVDRGRVTREDTPATGA